MPKVPSLLPQDLMQKVQPDPASFLLAAADLHASGQLEQAPRSMPQPMDTLKPAAPRTPRKLKVIK